MKTKFLTLALMALISFNVYAGGNSVGVVTNPLVNDQGNFMFGAGSHIGKPACSIVPDNQGWAFTIGTPAGKSMQALLMLAYAQGKTVHVIGSGDCNAWGDRERPSYIYLD